VARWNPGCEDGPRKGRLFWHKVPAIRGPHLTGYLWWFLANHLRRWQDRRAGGLSFDLVYSPGVNCLDADVISLHIVFREFYERVRGDLRLWRSPPASWPRIIHRRLYYRLVMALERLVYTREKLPLVAVSRKTADDLGRWHGSNGHRRVVYHGLDGKRFDRERRLRLREQARREVGIPERVPALLLVGNDWKNKGLRCLLEALARLPEADILLLVAGRDDLAPYKGGMERSVSAERVRFLPPRPDVEFYYAAADVYVGPSLEDAFALPPLEAMACGLPVIVSSQAGVSEVVTDGVDGLILRDPRDAEELAALIRRLYENPEERRRLGENASQTARQYTWDRNVAQMHEIFQEVIRWKAAT
jgi:UDP-glucose:(heptosyl)LPS alpha-1,3-glucosyltransferase